MKGIGKLLLVVFLLIFLFGGWVLWDIHRVRSFCAEVQPGMPISVLLQIADKHGIGKRWIVLPGVFDERENNWFIAVPAISSMGDVVCAIHHDKVNVLSARFSELP